VLRLSDGTQVTAGHVDYRGGDPGDGTFVDMFADARTVYIRTADGRGESLTAYELGTLRKVWRVEGVARVAAYTCAQVVCSVQPDSVEAFDPGTGRMLWRAPARQGAWPFAPGWLATDDGTINAYTLIEAATGRRITGLGQGVPVLEAAGTTGYLVGSTRSPANRSSVSRIDLGTGRAALRGTIDRISDYGCSATADRLICATQNGRLVVADVG
jgi:outer membrane protein assembly factor BamB